MKIHQLLTHGVILTNEEQAFVNSHPAKIEIDQLVERPRVIAHNLVRKGVYEISSDNKHLVRQNESRR